MAYLTANGDAMKSVCSFQKKRVGTSVAYSGHRTRGFTLIELLVVLTIVALMLTIAVPRYFQSIDVAKETVLVENLRVMRETIDRFYGDTGRYPDSLNELVTRRYLRSVPIDPMTDSTDTWVIVPQDEKTRKGVYNVKSGARGNGRAGKPLAEF